VADRRGGVSAGDAPGAEAAPMPVLRCAELRQAVREALAVAQTPSAGRGSACAAAAPPPHHRAGEHDSGGPVQAAAVPEGAHEPRRRGGSVAAAPEARSGARAAGWGSCKGRSTPRSGPGAGGSRAGSKVRLGRTGSRPRAACDEVKGDSEVQMSVDSRQDAARTAGRAGVRAADRVGCGEGGLVQWDGRDGCVLVERKQLQQGGRGRDHVKRPAGDDAQVIRWSKKGRMQEMVRQGGQDCCIVEALPWRGPLRSRVPQTSTRYGCSDCCIVVGEENLPA